MLRGTLVICCALALAGCQTAAQTAAPMPTDAPPVQIAAIKKALLADRARIWKEPESVRGAMIGEPYWCPRGTDQVATTCVCVEANAKNSFGGFTGVTKSGFKFANATEFSVLGTMGAYATCGNMTPFPEMNGRKS